MRGQVGASPAFEGSTRCSVQKVGQAVYMHTLADKDCCRESTAGSGSHTFGSNTSRICSELLYSLLVQGSLLWSHAHQFLMLLLGGQLAGNLRLEAA